jgi:hypothetical protein
VARYRRGDGSILDFGIEKAESCISGDIFMEK